MGRRGPTHHEEEHGGGREGSTCQVGKARAGVVRGGGGVRKVYGRQTPWWLVEGFSWYVMW
jgi:hypothetical protein